jgi:Rrf2 family nitric oxide-sensitive transcriptional repressor
MKLTRFTDYSLRVLIYLGVKDKNRVTIREIAEAFCISRNHLMKVVSMLTQKGYLDARRGPGGGIILARPASEINLAGVVRDMEDDMNLVECFCDNGQCVITSECHLRKVLSAALQAFFESLEGYSLQDLLEPRRQLSNLLSFSSRAA